MKVPHLQFHKNRFAMHRNRLEAGSGADEPETVCPASKVDSESERPRGEMRLGHVHLKVRDLNASLPFYTDLLGLNVTERIGRFAFLAIASEHHSLALEEVGMRAERPSQFAVGPAHFAFEVSHEADFFCLRRKIRNVGLPFTSQNNGISWSFGVRDPDGNEIEIYVDRRHALDGVRFWNGQWFRPYGEEENSQLTRTTLQDVVSVSSERALDSARWEVAES